MKAFAPLFLLISSFVFAQKPPSQAQVNKMMKEAQQMQKQMDQQIKDLEKTDPEQAKLIRNMMKGGQAVNKSDIGSEDFSLTYPTKAPVKDVARLNKIPSTPLSNVQLVELVKTMDGVTEYPSRCNPTTKLWQNLAMQYGREMDELKKLRLNEDSVATAIYGKEAAKYIDAPDELTNKWKAQLNAIAIKYCQKEIDLANNYLPQFADIQKNGFKEHADVFPSLINEAFFYSSLSPDDPTPLFEAHNALISYLRFLQAYSALTVIANTKANNFQGQGTVTVDCDIEQLKSEQ